MSGPDLGRMNDCSLPDRRYRVPYSQHSVKSWGQLLLVVGTVPPSPKLLRISEGESDIEFSIAGALHRETTKRAAPQLIQSKLPSTTM